MILSSLPKGTIRRFVAYGLASVAALGVDLACFLALLAAGLAAPAAATAGYALGIAAHWIASSRFVFAERLAEVGKPRAAQQALFIVSALIGLALTYAIVALGTHFGLDPRVAKLMAVLGSFGVTFLLRLVWVFAPQDRRELVAES